MQFVQENSGPGKMFPGGPTCVFNGKEVPCMVRYSKGGGMTTTILTDMFKTFEELKLFDRSEGKVPFFLLDGHGSRMENEFLEYINHPDHPWCVCLGVPYGTSLWQIGISRATSFFSRKTPLMAQTKSTSSSYF